MKLNFRIATFALAAALGLAATAVAQPYPEGTQPPSPPPQEASSELTVPALTDAQFVAVMIEHHEDGIELARLAESRGTNAEVKALAAQIRERQEQELALLRQHDTEAADTDMRGTGTGTTGMGTDTPDRGRIDDDRNRPGTTSTSGIGRPSEGGDTALEAFEQHLEDMADASKETLEDASGSEVDHAFTHEMAEHHQVALDLTANANFTDPELRALAQKMSAEQERELADLKRLQKTFPNPK